MFNISSFLEKFKKFDNDKTQQLENVIHILEEGSGLKIGKEKITIKNNVVFIHGSPLLKSEIYMKKEALMPLLSKEKIIDIR